MFEIINILIFLVSLIAFSIYYTLSIQPMKRSEKYGENAWKQCKNFRIIASIFETIATFNYILWIWFPLDGLDWKISDNWLIGIIIALLIFIPGLIIMLLGVKNAGKESIEPSPDTEMYGGIYKYIRHPQSLGEFPMFVAFGFFVNSWFLVLISILFILIYVPIMVIYEEKDLTKRFGEKYTEYQKTTGALFPKFKKNR